MLTVSFLLPTRIMKNILLIACLILGSTSAQSRIIYVKANATGLNNGTSWANAFTKFDSICFFQRDTSILDTVWIANGVYHPPYDSKFGYRIFNNGLKIYGGFSGTETTLAQRNWTGFQTIFDGEIGSPSTTNDNPRILSININRNFGEPSIIQGTAGNPAHPKFIIDGIKFTGGNAPLNLGNGSAVGGGAILYNGGYYDTLEVSHCLFTANSGSPGGAFYFSRWVASPGHTLVHIHDCVFDQNTGYFYGGAIGSRPTDTLYTHGIISSNSTINVNDCLFTNNTAPFGSAVSILDSFPVTFTRCIFRSNAAGYSGVFHDSALTRTRVFNSLFIGNVAGSFPIYFCRPPRPGITALPHTLIHCTIADNKSTSSDSSDFAIRFNGHDVIQNCIFWKNKTGSGRVMDTPIAGNSISTNILEGSPNLPNTVNSFDFDPLFVAPGTGYAIPFPSAAVFDYQLKPNSPAIDTGLNGISLNGPNALDLNDSNRFFGSRIDLGAYERSYCLARPPAIFPSKSLIFCQPDSVKLTAMAAGPGAFFWNGFAANPIWAKDSGIYHLIRDSAGCRSVNSVLVNAIPVPHPIITISGNTLSVPPVYASYQWFKNGSLIPGATAANYNPPANGIYSVAVTTRVGACPGSSAPFNLTNLAVRNSWPDGLDIAPNPFSTSILVADDQAALARIALYDFRGRLLAQIQPIGKSTSLDTRNYPAGAYLICIWLNNGTHLSRQLIKYED